MYVACSADPYLQDLHRCVSLACSWGTHHHGQAYTAQNSNGAAQQQHSKKNQAVTEQVPC